MRSKQWHALQELSLGRLRSRIPSGCPLLVDRRPEGGFRAHTFDAGDDMHGRFEVVHAFIDGFVCAWRRSASVDAVSRITLPSS